MRTKKAKLIPRNKILSVTVRHLLDDSPDTSWLGEYGSRTESDYAIDRRHSEECAEVSLPAKLAKRTLEHAQQTVGDLQSTINYDSDTTEWEALEEAYDLLGNLAEEVTDCDCGGVPLERLSYEYFNPCWENYKGLPEEEIRKYCRQDFERMESLNAGDFYFIGIDAIAQIGIPQGSPHPKIGQSYLCQKLTSGGLWGIESDSERSYLESEEKNQLADLRNVLVSFGFTRRAIGQAFKSIQRKDCD